MGQLLGSVLTVKVTLQLVTRGHPLDLSQLDHVVTSKTRGSLDPKRGWLLLLLLLLFTFLPKSLLGPQPQISVNIKRVKMSKQMFF